MSGCDATNPDSLAFLTIIPRPSSRAEYAKAAGEITAVYMDRWVNTRDEIEPWSDLTNTTVAAC